MIWLLLSATANNINQMRKQKQQPFFVKRVRLRKSIIKTHQLLQTMSIYDFQWGKQPTLSSNFKKQAKDPSENKYLSVNGITIDSCELYSSKSNRYNTKSIVKIFSAERNRDVDHQMNKAGLEIKKMFGSVKLTRKSKDKNHIKTKPRQQENQLHSTLNYYESASPSLSQQKNSNGYKSLQKCSTAVPSNRKNRVYLYEKMANFELNHQEENHVYEKRIKSYTQFLWKCMLAHNIYSNLDLQPPPLSMKKLKAFIGFGNNCNMIKGLLKRRFWWTISQQMTDDCAFIWTQTKINRIYERQQKAPNNLMKLSDKAIIENIEDKIAKSAHQNKRKQVVSAINRNSNLFQQFYTAHNKIFNKTDFQYLKDFLKRREYRLNQSQGKNIKERSYESRTEQICEKYKSITSVQDWSQIKQQSSQTNSFYQVKPLVHNHLQNNFFLGNKKALFYNLKEYYHKIGEDIFSYVPLTFHIKQGLKDPQYTKFTKYYAQRAKIISSQERNEETNKTRNIWIVKPGQNSNQGRGIVVIDQIYELDNIIKQSSKGTTSKQNDVQAKTFIVQLYIDRPFLYNDRKFDIRHYMLITNLFGITRAYWYEQGYIRTSAYYFNIHCFQPEIHLTNDAIQKKYPEYGKYQPFNKISYSEFQNYLNLQSDAKKYNFKQTILTQMKKMGKDAARSVYTKINPQNQMHNFQIFGLDFMIDKNFKPWLIQINTNPCLDCACPLLDRIIPYMVEQAFKLTLDIVYPLPTHYPKTSKHYAPLINLQHFKYQLIFDSSSEGDELVKQLYSSKQNDIMGQIGTIDEQQEFKDEGKEIKLQDFT